MQYRKLISFGRGSYIICVPKSWVEKNKLKKGDLISLSETTDELTLSLNNSNVKREEKTITIEAEKKSVDMIRTEIISAYLNNYDLIEVISKDLKTNAPEIKEIMRNLAGMEILEQTSSRIVAKDLISMDQISLKTIIRRMDVITRAMIEDAIRCIDKENVYESIHQRDLDVNRLHFLSYRVIRNALKNPDVRRALNTDAWELHIYKQMVMRIEKIADRQKRIARYLRNIKMQKSTAEELKKLYDEMKNRYLDVMKAYYTNDKKLAFDVEVTNKSRILACEDFHRKHTSCSLRIKSKMDVLACPDIARIVENLKAMTTSIKYIARKVISMDD